MAGRLAGETVTVHVPTVTYDEHNERIETTAPVEVSDVLVRPSTSSDAGEVGRPEADEAVWALAFPKDFALDDLRGCTVTVRGEEYEVMGEPRHIGANCPTRWDMQADVRRKDG